MTSGRKSLEMLMFGWLFSTPSGEGTERLEDAYDSGLYGYIFAGA